jgi:hypothetical protein
MQEKSQKILLICLEVISLAIILPIFYWGTFKLLFVPLVDVIYYPNRKVSTLVAFFLVLSFDLVWIFLMKLCPKDKMHVKVILTLLVLAFSAAILTCFVVADALEGAFS